MVVGEQPGDQEDRTGAPFVGPAGKLLDKALLAADIDRTSTYVTNAVKHFKFTRSDGGKRRIHKKPGRTEIVACTPWLRAEMETVRPEVVVCLGATAAQTLLGTDFRLTEQRGKVFDLATDGALSGTTATSHVVATIHPSALLRGPSEDRAQGFEALVADLKVAAELL